MTQLGEVVNARVDFLKKLYDLSGGVEHDGEKGAFREFFVAELLRPLLPNQFGVGSGVVTDRDGRQSRQTDVIIYDRRRIQPILAAGERGLYAVDGVVAVCEVKSRLSATHYGQIGEAASYFHPRHANGLKIYTPSPLGENKLVWPAFAVFAYESDAAKEEPERLREQVTDGLARDAVRLITVLSKGTWAYKQEDENKPGRWEKATARSPGQAFVLELLNKLENVASSRGDFRLEGWL